MKGMELLGRHIGALTNEKALNKEETAFYSFLGAAMERERLASEMKILGDSGNEDTEVISLPNTLEGAARIIE